MSKLHNVEWSELRTLSTAKQNAIYSYAALDLFAKIANQRKYTLTLSPKKYSDKPVEYHCIAMPHGANSKPIRGEGESPEDAIIDLWNKLSC